MTLRGSVMVCGTASDVGKSRIVAGLCRVLNRQGVDVAPFKAQNMALNSCVTTSGHEIARSQAHQAAAARIAPVVEMNPILLKPSGDLRSQLVVMGRPAGEVVAGDYLQRRQGLESIALQALEALRARHDVVIAEGAGGAAEINLLDGDLVNLPLARRAGLPAILVGDIERGGVFAALYGTVALLPDELRAPLRGFIINKLRGDAHVLESGVRELERRCTLPCLGVLPHLGELLIDAEDSLALEHRPLSGDSFRKGDILDIAVIRLPHLANFTDFDPLALEPGVALRYVTSAGLLGSPDLVILPGSKATVADLAWLRLAGFEQAISHALGAGSSLLGICAGYQMLGTRIVDQVESRSGEVAGLGLLEATTEFSLDKCTRQRYGADPSGTRVCGYEIHHGQVKLGGGASWFRLERDEEQEEEGARDETRGIFATSLHGIFEVDAFRGAFLVDVARRAGKRFVGDALPFDARRQAEIDRVADALEAHLDLDRILEIVAEGAPR
ncbi:MAG TPA: cobyric acid synthase [Chloroflexota bacterium]|nr:cobyric acid synthase [Chloroflexota bacterium]